MNHKLLEKINENKLIIAGALFLTITLFMFFFTLINFILDNVEIKQKTYPKATFEFFDGELK